MEFFFFFVILGNRLEMADSLGLYQNIVWNNKAEKMVMQSKLHCKTLTYEQEEVQTVLFTW